MQNNIIFLDIDGVLNSRLYYETLNKPRTTRYDDICPQRLEWLNNLCKETNSVVVITSSWRIEMKTIEQNDLLLIENTHDYETGEVESKVIETTKLEQPGIGFDYKLLVIPLIILIIISLVIMKRRNYVLPGNTCFPGAGSFCMRLRQF